MNAVLALKAEHSLTTLLTVASLARSTFFYHQARLDTADKHAALKAEIQRFFHHFAGRYGHRRIHDRLRRTGWVVSKKTVLKLMRALGLRCQIRRKRYTSFKGKIGQIAANRLERDFTTTAPNQKWVTDVTEFRVGERKVYLSTVMDLFDRQIIGHTTGTSPNLVLTNTSLRQALVGLPSDQKPIVHSDQGCQYASQTYKDLLARHSLVASMSRKGNCWDNAVMERFFLNLKMERVWLRDYANHPEAQADIADYIVNFYNAVRLHSTLGYQSPCQYEQQHAAAN